MRDLQQPPDRDEPSRVWLADEFRQDEAQRSPDARAILTELGIEAGGTRRQLLESATFRALLEDVPLAEAA